MRGHVFQHRNTIESCTNQFRCICSYYLHSLQRNYGRVGECKFHQSIPKPWFFNLLLTASTKSSSVCHRLAKISVSNYAPRFDLIPRPRLVMLNGIDRNAHQEFLFNYYACYRHNLQRFGHNTQRGRRQQGR